jgi:hypothetical protein
VSPGRSTPGRRPSERELLEAVAAEFRDRGYRTYLDPDGTDYFDLAVRRNDEVGLIEGKVGSPSAVLGQALRRRPWADWVAVVLGSERSGSRLAARTSGRRASVVGIWSYEGGLLRELRAPARGHAEPPDPFGATRARFRQHLLDLDRGTLPPGVRWSSVASEVRRASGGRGFSEWRLDELPDGPP